MATTLINQNDIVVPFMFENVPVRGALIQLRRVWARMQLGQNYATPVSAMLGQAAAATGLIAQSLKFDGRITLQISGGGPLSMLVMQSTADMQMRGMANATDIAPDIAYAELVTKSRCAITVDTGEAKHRYQGIVEMLGDSLSHSLANYFARSVQVESHIMLVADRHVSGGILLQQMPDMGAPVDDDWRRLGMLAATLRTEDLATGVGASLIGKFFSQDDVRMFDPRPALFHCHCSRERAAEVLKLLGEQETRATCEERGRVDVVCEYCGERQSFDNVDIARLFAEQTIAGSELLH